MYDSSEVTYKWESVWSFLNESTKKTIKNKTKEREKERERATTDVYVNFVNVRQFVERVLEVLVVDQQSQSLIQIMIQLAVKNGWLIRELQ
jgi:hypothetical protein